MTARNSILLIVKQQPGIEYNELLNKISGNYGSIESARAALSRSIRYLNALGLVARRGNNLFATGKGTALLNSEMQNKLLLRLNEFINGKDPSTRFDKGVELMQTLIERSKQDKDLLLAAQGSVDFYVSDLAGLERDVEKRIHSLQYLHKIFEQQVSSLKELDFPDFKRMGFDKESKSLVKGIAKELRAKVFTAECGNEVFRQKALEHFHAKGRQHDLFLETKQLPKFLDFVENNCSQRNPVTIFISGIKVKIDFPYIFFTGPYKQLQKLLGGKK
jgi:hypothetical protein